MEAGLAPRVDSARHSRTPTETQQGRDSGANLQALLFGTREQPAHAQLAAFQSAFPNVDPRAQDAPQKILQHLQRLGLNFASIGDARDAMIGALQTAHGNTVSRQELAQKPLAELLNMYRELPEAQQTAGRLAPGQGQPGQGQQDRLQGTGRGQRSAAGRRHAGPQRTQRGGLAPPRRQPGVGTGRSVRERAVQHRAAVDQAQRRVAVAPAERRDPANSPAEREFRNIEESRGRWARTGTSLTADDVAHFQRRYITALREMPVMQRQEYFARVPPEWQSVVRAGLEPR